ncbi:MAG: hypothetical protein AB7E98_12010 [Pirellulales bacterium]
MRHSRRPQRVSKKIEPGDVLLFAGSDWRSRVIGQAAQRARRAMRQCCRTLVLCFAVAVLVNSVGCQAPQKKTAKQPTPTPQRQLAAWPAQPVIDIPLEERQRNPDGSCVHCSWVTCLNNQRMYALADAWFAKYRHGESAMGLRRKADAEGIRYADTTAGDVAFVEWAIRTRRGCLVNDKPGHVRTLVGLDPATPGAKAYVLDNNGPPERVIEYPRDEWIAMWQRRGGWAATPLYDPRPVVTHP